MTRSVHTELVLWLPPMPKLTQQALSKRLQTLPAELFERVLATILPVMQTRWHAGQRPLPPEVAWAQAHFGRFLIADGSTLDALMRRVKLLPDGMKVGLAGRMLALLDGASRLPVQVWFESNPTAHDTHLWWCRCQRFWAPVQAALRAGDLLLVDLGFTNFSVFAELTVSGVVFITRAKTNLAFQVDHKWITGTGVRDWQVTVGSGESTLTLRLIQVRYRGKWYRYLTNALELPALPTA